MRRTRPHPLRLPARAVDRVERNSRRIPSHVVGFTVATLALAACAHGTTKSGRDQERIRGVLDGTTRASAAMNATVDIGSPPSGPDWQTLFDGTSLAGWHGFKTPGKAPPGWQAVEGELVRMAAAEDLVTDRTYANFELALEWNIAPKGNSGVMFRIDPTADVTYESGPEMQVLDDAGHPDGGSRLTSAGSAYGLYPSPPGIVKPPGQWNSVRLLVNGAHVEHWLNGERVVTYELWSPDWEAKVKASKFAQWPGYGRSQRGYIALQDHGDRVAYRNIRIRELP
jgi:hypothetical protein